MPKTVTTQIGALGGYQPSLGMATYRRCSQCHVPHPHVMGFPDLNTCHECGFPSQPPSFTQVDAKLLGFWGWVADKCLKLGLWLARKAKELRSGK